MLVSLANFLLGSLTNFLLESLANFMLDSLANFDSFDLTLFCVAMLCQAGSFLALTKWKRTVSYTDTVYRVRRMHRISLRNAGVGDCIQTT